MKRWIEKHAVGITFAFVLAIMVMIFCFSAQTGEESGAMSGRITTWILHMFRADFDDLPAEQQQNLCSAVGLVIRKGAHFSEYALLGLSLMLHIRQIQKKTRVRLPWLWSWVVGTLYAVSDELHQGFVGGRYPAVTDVLIDSSGVITGTLLLLLICFWRQGRENHRIDPKKQKKQRSLRKKT
ncbi:MAG: VanZ family protein [Faecousia sp.]